jgi:hypothetical protein
MKKVIPTILQFVLFLLVFGAGSFFPPFHFEHILIATPGPPHLVRDYSVDVRSTS